MAEYATSLDGDTLKAFQVAAAQIAEEKGMNEADVWNAMKKLIYLYIARI